ncbi:MAG: carboxymuconolactone decarboxylase family protein [Alphaproteobacteria bacterium]|nr:MAG: carboxymuconolactone decarboxylase family protein [Alphaproteobacteria bacterium]
MKAEDIKIVETDRLPLCGPPYDEQTRKAIENSSFTGLSPNYLRLALAHHPLLARRFQSLAQAVLFEAGVDLRPKEIAIMRTAALTGSEYVWGMHVSIFGERCNLDEAAIRDLTLAKSWQDLKDDRWSAEDRLAIRMVDELHFNSTISDETWKEMSATWSYAHFIELIFASGVYHLSSFFINSAAVPLEDGQARFPEEYEKR